MPLGPATLKPTDIRPEGVLLHVASVEGAPVNGTNLVSIPFVAAGVDPSTIDESHLEVDAAPLSSGSSVTFCSRGVHPTPLFPGGALSANRDEIALDFEQAGADSVYLEVRLLKTEVQ